MANIIIFEDDPAFVESLCSKLVNLGYWVSLSTDSIEQIEKHLNFTTLAEIYLLDIMIEGKPEGISLFEKIKGNNRDNVIIFLTDYINLILSNPYYKIYCFSCIFKENIDQELAETLELAAEYIQAKNLFIYKSKFNKISIVMNEILYIETALGKNRGQLYIYHSTGIYTMRTQLNTLLKHLDDQFVRCHRSFIVNTRKIEMVDKNNKLLKLRNGYSCPYSLKEFGKWL